ncbi:PDZ domain-containing protein [Lentisphaera marina]|uniref:PDZ domain-containing protein n=1 Tax=Lentisphaera marina TaxID=1111041 RepID=UPI0023660FF9|nr:PDZ domain-containing protein [Lentisphaera marina]MDD7984530.1 PDZ domain-containing protein [Lentisphaera marina]
MTFRYLILFTFLINQVVAEIKPLNDKDTLPVLSSKTLSIQKAVYSLHHKGKQIALASAFTKDGYLITSLKNFEEGTLIKDEIGGLYPVDLIGTDPKSHITVIRSPFKLSPPSYGKLAINTGTLLTSVNSKEAFSFGIVSLAPYEAIQSNFYQTLRFPLDARPKILFVKAGSPEEEAGLKIGDIIHSINDTLMYNGRETLEKMRSLRINEKVLLDVIRGGKIFKTTYKPQRSKQYHSLPKRMVFQHDIPLKEGQYGGPICLINGKFAGITLDHATPSGSYAIKPNDCAQIARSIIKNRNQNSVNK